MALQGGRLGGGAVVGGVGAICVGVGFGICVT